MNRVSREGEAIGRDERISAYEALKAITCNVAWWYREEKSTLEPSRPCDPRQRPGQSRSDGHQGHQGGADDQGGQNHLHRGEVSACGKPTAMNITDLTAEVIGSVAGATCNHADRLRSLACTGSPGPFPRYAGAIGRCGSVEWFKSRRSGRSRAPRKADMVPESHPLPRAKFFTSASVVSVPRCLGITPITNDTTPYFA